MRYLLLIFLVGCVTTTGIYQGMVVNFKHEHKKDITAGEYYYHCVANEIGYETLWKGEDGKSYFFNCWHEKLEDEE